MYKMYKNIFVQKTAQLKSLMYIFSIKRKDFL